MARLSDEVDHLTDLFVFPTVNPLPQLDDTDQMRSNRQIGSFFSKTASVVDHLNMIDIVDMASSYKEENLWPQKRPERSLKLCLAATGESHWSCSNNSVTSWGAHLRAQSANSSGKYVEIRGRRTNTHQDQLLVERFNPALAERLFGHYIAINCVGS